MAQPSAHVVASLLEISQAAPPSPHGADLAQALPPTVDGVAARAAGSPVAAVPFGAAAGAGGSAYPDDLAALAAEVFGCASGVPLGSLGELRANAVAIDPLPAPRVSKWAAQRTASKLLHALARTIKDERITERAKEAVRSWREYLAGQRVARRAARDHLKAVQGRTRQAQAVRAGYRALMAACVEAIRDAKVGLRKARDFKRRHDRWGAIARDVHYCHRAVARPVVTFHRSPSRATASMIGFQVCGGATRCPICANAVAAGRAKDIAEGLGRLFEAGGFVAMLTNTASHHRGTDPIWMTTALLDAAEIYWRDGTVRRWLADLGHVGSIKSTEITDGEATGPHPHRHTLLLFDRRPSPLALEQFETDLAAAWMRACRAVGLHAELGPGSKLTHRLDVAEGDSERAARYASKMGLETALVATKQGAGGRRTLTELLACAHHGDRWAARRWQLWQVALRGRTLVKWSEGLRARLGLAPELTDAQLAERKGEADETAVAEVTAADARRIVSTAYTHQIDLRPVLLRAFAQEDWHTIAAVADSLAVTFHPPGTLDTGPPTTGPPTCFGGQADPPAAADNHGKNEDVPVIVPTADGEAAASAARSCVKQDRADAIERAQAMASRARRMQASPSVTEDVFL